MVVSQRHLLSLTLSLLALTASETRAQSTSRLADRDHCDSCRIQMRLELAIGDTSGPAMVDGIDVIWTKDSTGRLFHSGYHIGPEIRVFDGGGHLVQTLGRHGLGPGEFRGRSPLFVGKGDTLHVFNSGNRTHNVFAPDLRFVRSQAVPVIPTSTIESPSGDLVAAAALRSPEGIGYPLHLITRTGKYISSFGATDPYVGPGSSFQPRQLVRTRSNNTFLSLHRYRFTIEEWGWDGALRRILHADPSWFRPLKPLSGPGLPLDGSSPLPSVLVGGNVDTEGLLWLVFNIPDSNWQDAFLVHGRPSVHGIEPSRLHLWDSMIVVVDLEQGIIVKRGRTERWIGGFVGSDVFVNTESVDGHPRVEFWSLRLAR